MAPIYDTKVPDLQPNTHIIGLCGVADVFDEDVGRSDTDPQSDGWMLSDFYMFEFLLRGLGRSQRWFTCVNPELLIARYGELAHGNCYHDRKVVLDANQKPDPSTLQIEAPQALLPVFLEYLTAQCATACAANEPVLLCVFSHGEYATYSCLIGSGDTEASAPKLEVGDILGVLDANKDLQLCMLMTSCFSGGWAITPDLASTYGRRLTVMAAAGSQVESESWPATRSLGRACGSIYTTAILKALVNSEDSTSEASSDVLTTREFAHSITYQLLNLVDPRMGHRHGHQFEVQDDQWSQLYHQRTGIPLAHYHNRLQQLRSIPRRPVLEIRMDRSATDDEVIAWDRSHPYLAGSGLPGIAMGNFGGSLRALRQSIRHQAIAYLKSNPGRDSLANNISAHNHARRCVEAPSSMTDEMFMGVWHILQHRMTQIELAETLLRRFRIPAPRPHQFDYDTWSDTHNDLCNYADQIARKIALAKIFPDPKSSGAGRPWSKPRQYMSAALAESGLALESIEEIVRRCGYMVDATVNECVKDVEASMTVRKRATTWLRGWKERARSLSPSKRSKIET